MSIKFPLAATTVLAIAAAAIPSGPAQAVSITGWNTGNVDVAPSPAEGVTGVSVVYDRDPNNPAARSSGQIVFTPPEAISPGIQVAPEVYTSGVQLDGCLMTSNPTATCTSPFQSGKRIKQQMTGSDPVDLVFDVETTSPGDATYQVFGRLINVTGKAIRKFTVELGFGIGSAFTAVDGLSISTEFQASPRGSGSASTQFPFGLFGDASTSKNFLLDGFYDDARTGLTVSQTMNVLTSGAYFGEYDAMFGPWLSQEDVPTGFFWDNDDSADTDALLMAWEYAPDLWELRRTPGQTCDPSDATNCINAETLSVYEDGYSLADLLKLFDDDYGITSGLSDGAVEDLANLNVNYAINVDEAYAYESLTIRTMVAPVPLPAGGPMLLAGFSALGLLMRRRRAGAA